MENKKRLIFIFGPTGVGKTRLAVNVSEGIGEIISVDSMQVYRGLDIGTAKPGEEERRRVPHHLIDIVPPDYRFSAGDFRRLALKAIDEIYGRMRIPVLVGGTGLYFRALEYSLIEAPPADLALRRSLYTEEEMEKGRLYRKLFEVDPETARKLHSNDLVRIIRALEVHALTGIRLSDFLKMKNQRKFEILKIGIIIDRKLLYSAIEERCREMVNRGLGGEVYRLLMQGYTEECPSMKGLGYSHFIQYFKGCYSSKEVLRLFQRDTKHYAKRQLTWFRREKGTFWHGPDEFQQVRERIDAFMAKR